MVYITNSLSYFHFQGHSLNISCNYTVKISPKSILSDDCTVTLKVIPNNNMTLVNERQQITQHHIQNIVLLKVLYKFVNFNLTLVICLKFVFLLKCLITLLHTRLCIRSCLLCEVTASTCRYQDS